MDIKRVGSNLPLRDRQSGSLARYVSIRFFRRLIRRWFKALASHSNRVRGLRGIHIRLVRLSLLREAAAGPSIGAGR